MLILGVFLLLLLFLLTFPISNISRFIAPFALLLSLLLFQGEIQDFSNSNHTLTSLTKHSTSLITLIFIFLLCRISSLFITRIIMEPYLSLGNSASSSGYSIPIFNPKRKDHLSFMILVQGIIFLYFIESGTFWNLITANGGGTFTEKFSLYAYHLVLLTLPLMIASLGLHIALLAGLSITRDKVVHPLYSIANSLGLLAVFYFSLPLVKSYIEGIS